MDGTVEGGGKGKMFWRIWQRRQVIVCRQVHRFSGERALQSSSVGKKQLVKSNREDDCVSEDDRGRTRRLRRL